MEELLTRKRAAGPFETLNAKRRPPFEPPKSRKERKRSEELIPKLPPPCFNGSLEGQCMYYWCSRRFLEVLLLFSTVPGRGCTTFTLNINVDLSIFD